MRSVAFVTVGCKLNQFETEQMREAVEDLGWDSCAPHEDPDVYVINTCTVTSKSDYRSRQAIRRAIRSNPQAAVIVTGCYAQLAPYEIALITGVDAVIGNAEKDEITRYITLGKQPRPLVRVTEIGASPTISSRRHLHRFGKYTRAFVKIQDGCNNRCSYCAVPLARGRSRSKKPEDVRTEIEVLAEEGYREIVLTGVHLGAYGHDLCPPRSLANLLESIAPIAGLERIRLSSVEPTDFSDELISMIADPALRICPHVHVPLQSGDDRILRLMGRPYGAAFYADLIDRIADQVPLCGIGADVMVGFPGEDSDAFSNTYDLLTRLPVTYLHVFAYSMRYDTAASAMDAQVEPRRKKERSRILRALGRQKSLRFRQALVGKTVEVLVLGRRTDGPVTGLTANYVKAVLTRPGPVNAIIPCLVTQVSNDGVLTVPEGHR